MKRHIIWDWNGTLIDDTWLCVELSNRQLRSYNLPELDRDRFRDIFTFPIQLFYERLGFDLKSLSFPELSEEFHEWYKERRAECRLHNGVTEKLMELSYSGHTHSILSAHRHSMLEEIIDLLELRPHFTELVGAEDTLAHSKVDLGIKWLRRSGIDPKQAVFVGDTDHDAEVARAMGVPCILIAHGYQNHRILAQTEAVIVDSLHELSYALQRS